MIFNFLIFFIFSRGIISEFPEISIEYLANTKYSISDLYISHSNHAYVLAITGDDEQRYETLKVSIIGYILSILSPKIDRVLLIPTTFQATYEVEERIGKYFTHVYRTPFINFPCKNKIEKLNHKHIWFKLNAWTITNYESILWIGHESFFIKDPSSIFNFKPPAAPPDFQIWNFSEFGPIHNNDLLLIKPSIRDFKLLKKMACDWISKPEFGNRNTNQSFLGAFDNGLIELFYKDEFTTLSKYWQYEITENFKFNSSDEIFNSNIKSFRFTNGYFPWENSKNIISQTWILIAEKVFLELGIVITTLYPSIKLPKSNLSYLLLFNKSIIINQFNIKNYLNTFTEFYIHNNSKIILFSILIIFFSIFLLFYNL